MNGRFTTIDENGNHRRFGLVPLIFITGRRQYQQRAGVEGTISQAVRGSGLRQARYHGLAKTHLQHLATAAALNLGRAVAHWEGKKPAQTRVSRFARAGNVPGATTARAA